jgi:hypothetical protein
MNIYLYEGARQRNVMMMLHALALGADKNFINENDQGRTPLIQTILSVCYLNILYQIETFLFSIF